MSAFNRDEPQSLRIADWMMILCTLIVAALVLFSEAPK